MKLRNHPNLIKLGLVVGSLLAFIVIANEALGTVEPYGNVYPVNCSSCVSHIRSSNASICLRHETKTEMRQSTHVTGFFFNFDSYNVVDKTK